ncbi:hypothetical protein KL905_001384 [Ogataea polymorpha]|nr:hypothetical protein KL937_002775 [Ogataea polymorpha]KAG7896977.1 hypothetical protein KL908_000379 [Ogataea polymorpha]KAG7913252.1 hypothetical protein KL907_000197 [Ogataea polymorpha]KAG7923118.1 hypothetical protein KL905_001384 [Ogataea polymorpha]KAG7937774.1 hypothetical protein KL904_001921 [Ogataea polymorpha]
MSQRKVCPYFQNGNCRYGNRCHNLHIKNGHEDLKSFTSTSSLQAKTEDIRKNIDAILPDVRNGAILTAFSLPPPANVNIISGRDVSYEELRVQYYQNPDTAVHEYNSRKQDMIKCLEYVRKDAQKAARYLQLAAEKNPADVKPFINFSIDMNPAPSSSLPFGNRGSSPFNQQSSSLGSAKNHFGAPAAQSNPFGTAVTTNANPFASSNTPAFGSAGFGSKPNPFGSQTSTNSVSNPFGSSSGASSGFGKTGFGQPTGAFASVKPNPFGGQSNASSSTASPFGAISGNTMNSSTMSFPNGVGAGASSSAGPFGGQTSTIQPSPFGAGSQSTTSNAGPFGNPQTSSAFGNTGFGSFGAQKASPFGQQTANAGVFGQAATKNVSSSSPFTQPSSAPFGQAQNSPFVQPSAASLGQTTNPTPTGFKQAAIEEQPTKVDDLSESIINEFKAEHFKLGLVPDVPPPLEMC